MFCDVTVSVPERDTHGKLGAHSADGCHLGYDERRNAHFVYCSSLRRLSTFIVTEWREDSFEHGMRLSSDTPVEYVDTMDFPVGGVSPNSSSLAGSLLVDIFVPSRPTKAIVTYSSSTIATATTARLHSCAGTATLSHAMISPTATTCPILRCSAPSSLQLHLAYTASSSCARRVPLPPLLLSHHYV